MTYMRQFRRKVFFPSVRAAISACSFLMASSSQLHAMENVGVVSKILDKNNPISKATVVIIPDPFEALMAVDEVNLVRIGCTYVTQDKLLIGRLIGILENAGIKTKDKKDYLAVDMRQGVFLKLEDGSEIKFFFSSAMPNVSVSGKMVAMNHGEVTPFISLSVTEQLMSWAPSAGTNSNHQNSIDEIRTNCDKNIR